MSILYLLFLLLVALIAFVLLRSLMWGKGRGLPGAWDHLFPLNRFAVALSLRPTDPAFFLHCHDQLGSTFHTNAFGADWIVTKDLALIKHVFEDRENYQLPLTFRKGATYEMGTSMFSSEGELWKKKHQLLQPMLRQRMLEKHVDVVYAKATKLVKVLEARSSKPIQLMPLLKNMTVDIIGEVAFGTDFGALEGKPLTGKMTLPQFLDISLESINNRILYPEWAWELGQVRKAEKEASVEAKKMFNRIIEAARHKAQQEGDEPTTLISLLLSIEEKEKDLPEQERVYPPSHMIGECFSLFGAGADTTANTLAMMYQLLATHPEVQEKLREEILRVVQRKKDAGEPEVLQFKDVQDMHYLAAVISEAQRLCPAANVLVREVMGDDEFKGMPLRTGTWLFLNVHAIQRDPANYKDPESFKPERWLAPDAPSLTSYQFLTFGHGRRSCFGRPLALMEMKVATFLLLQHFVLKLDTEHPAMELEQKFGLRPKDNQLWVQLEGLK